MRRNTGPSHVTDLFDAYETLHGTEARQRFCLEIFTRHERDTLRKRWTIMRLLSQGVAQREIARTQKVSLCKITRGARILRNKKSMVYQLLRTDRRLET